MYNVAMSEGFGRGESPSPAYEEGPERASEVRDTIKEEALLSLRELVSNRWERIESENESWADSQDSHLELVSPAEYLQEIEAAWGKRHENSEYVDTGSAMDRIQLLLSELVEKQDKWAPAKKAAVRRVLVGFATQAKGSLHPIYQSTLDQTILKDEDLLSKIGPPTDEEREIIDRWMRITAGATVQRSPKR